MPAFRQISPTQLRDWLQSDPDGIFLLDVREPHEHARCKLPQSYLIPLGAVHHRTQEIPRDARVICYCHHGMRSARACALLAEQGFTRLYNLDGGIDRWSEEIDPAVPRY